MKNKNPVKYNFFAQIMILFAADVLILSVISRLFGDGAKEISTLYRLGSKGLSFETLLQFLANSIIIISLKSIFFSEKIFKSMMSLWRIVLMLASIFLVSVLFVIAFGWFPIDNVYAWTGFLLCFGGGFSVGMLAMILKTNYVNKKYEKLLLTYKNQHGEGDENE
jgi:hypothetical protein